MSIASITPRHRRFKVTSNHLTRHIFEDGLRRPNIQRYVGVNHDLDGGSPHVQGCIELREARTVKQVENMWPVTVQVKLLVGSKGDRSSWARYVRYLTHESPAEQAKGKYHYPDSAFFASEGYDWRADVDALTRKEGYKIPLLEEMKLKIIAGEMTSLDVSEQQPQLYAGNYKALERADEQYEHLELLKILGGRKFEARRARIERTRLTAAERMQNAVEALVPTQADGLNPEPQAEPVRPDPEADPQLSQEQAERDQIHAQEERDDLILVCLKSSEEQNEPALWSAVRNRLSAEFSEFPEALEWLGFTLDQITAEVTAGKFTLEGARMLGAYVYDHTYGSDGYLEDLLGDVRRELGRVA